MHASRQRARGYARDQEKLRQFFQHRYRIFSRRIRFFSKTNLRSLCRSKKLETRRHEAISTAPLYRPQHGDRISRTGKHTRNPSRVSEPHFARERFISANSHFVASTSRRVLDSPLVPQITSSPNNLASARISSIYLQAGSSPTGRTLTTRRNGTARHVRESMIKTLGRS